MDNVMIVGGLKSGHHLDRDTDRLFCRKLPLLFNIIFQSNAFHKFHDHIEQSSVLSHIIDIYHIRVHQSRRSLGLTYKFLDKYLIIPVIAF